MKIKGEYVIREVVGEKIAMPVGETVIKSNVLIVLNDTGAFFWSLLASDSTEEEIVAAVCKEYEVDKETVKADLEEFVRYLRKNGVEVE